MEQKQNLFRIGSCYRDAAGRVFKLYENTTALMARSDGPFAWAKYIYEDGTEEGAGLRSLVDGRDNDEYFTWDGVRRDLLPGELMQVGGEWVAKEEAEAEEMTFDELMADLFSPANAAMIARDGPAKPKADRWSVPAGSVVSTAKPNPFARFKSPDGCSEFAAPVAVGG